MHDSDLWKRTLGPSAGTGPNIERLRTALDGFRTHVEQLLQTLRAELPNLTVHDITHLDALWRVAGEIAGPDFPINPAEAFVLGGAILLHDAAHVLAAYPEGLRSIKQTGTWKDVIAQQFGGNEPERHSAEENEAVFHVLRSLHARQAHTLATVSWKHPEDPSITYLLEDNDLRRHYGDLIGRIAESHHWPTYRIASEFSSRILPAPGFLQPETWSVDALKIALVLRTADAAHLDDLRAPWFLFALQKPTGISGDHWKFQGRMSQPKRNDQGLLVIASGQPFFPKDRKAWWLAFDTAQMIDREIRDANQLLLEYDRKQLATSAVLDIHSPDMFSRHVPTEDWLPIDASPKVGNTAKLIAMLGGKALYGDDLSAGLRELLQNAIDATHALRRLGGLADDEGSIDVLLEPAPDGAFWLHVTDVGIGMGRYVLTNVLLDFGRSLWTSSQLLDEFPGLASTGFDPIGRFGIGFFASFMLGDQVRIVTRRFEPTLGETVSQWKVEFENGLSDRPVLSEPDVAEQLKRSGTRVSIHMTRENVTELLQPISSLFAGQYASKLELELENLPAVHSALHSIVGAICPTSDVTIRASVRGDQTTNAVSANDWLTMPSKELAKRVGADTEVLNPLYDRSGQLLGRLGIVNWWDSASAVTVNGVRNGYIRGLAGVCVSRSGGTEASRQDAKPAGNLGDWIVWAEAYIDSAGTDRELASRIHPLLNKLDLPVWTIQGEDATAFQVEEFLSKVDRVVLHFGDIDYDADDDVSRSAFAQLSISGNVVTCPSLRARTRNDFAGELGAGKIEYGEVFLQILRRAWGAFERLGETYLVVGDVDGIEITRSGEEFVRG
jgi:hypothetical protein